MNLNILSPFQWKNQRKTKLVTEKSENQSYSYGCIMGYFNVAEYNKLNNRIGSIDDKDIYNNDENEYGREIEPHVTVLYGLHDDELDQDEVIQLLKCLKLPTVKLAKISSFNNEKFDVLKWDVESEDLNLYNKIVTLMFPFTSKFPDYHAHCTIAYLIPGKAKTYSKEIKEIIELPIEKWVYSKADGTKVCINSKGEIEELRKAEDDKVVEYFKTQLKKVSHIPVSKFYKEDESYDYKGYHIELEQNKKYRMTDDNQYGYMCRVFKDGQYLMGLKGPVSLERAKRDAEYWINGTIEKDEQTST